MWLEFQSSPVEAMLKSSCLDWLSWLWRWRPSDCADCDQTRRARALSERRSSALASYFQFWSLLDGTDWATGAQVLRGTQSTMCGCSSACTWFCSIESCNQRIVGLVLPTDLLSGRLRWRDETPIAMQFGSCWVLWPYSPSSESETDWTEPGPSTRLNSSPFRLPKTSTVRVTSRYW